jgi:hypothetical protein
MLTNSLRIAGRDDAHPSSRRDVSVCTFGFERLRVARPKNGRCASASRRFMLRALHGIRDRRRLASLPALALEIGNRLSQNNGVRTKVVPHLRRSGSFLYRDPALPGWAMLCQTYGLDAAEGAIFGPIVTLFAKSVGDVHVLKYLARLRVRED